MAPRTRSVLTPAGGASREERREDFSITTGVAGRSNEATKKRSDEEGAEAGWSRRSDGEKQDKRVGLDPSDLLRPLAPAMPGIKKSTTKPSKGPRCARTFSASGLFEATTTS